MNLESICVSLETAKKLKEAGWNKETMFCWKGIIKRKIEDNVRFKREIKLISKKELDDLGPIVKIRHLELRDDREIEYHFGLANREQWGIYDEDFKDILEVYFAPTSAEIELPDKYSIHRDGDKYWVTRLMPLEDDGLMNDYSGDDRLYDTEVEAKAKMWLYLKEKKLV